MSAPFALVPTCDVVTGPGQAVCRVEQAVCDLLLARAPGATVCPSEVARRIAPPATDWRAQMEVVHAAVDGLLAKRAVRLSWRGVVLGRRAGPYRIALR